MVRKWEQRKAYKLWVANGEETTGFLLSKDGNSADLSLLMNKGIDFCFKRLEFILEEC